MPANPFCILSESGEPLVELKMVLLLFVKQPPNPEQARTVFDLFMSTYGKRIRLYCSTAAGSGPQPWNPQVHARMQQVLLPNLRKYRDWGYGFADGKLTDSTLFMVHGYRPHTEPGKASFYRIELPWNEELMGILQFSKQIIESVPFCNGMAGYYLQSSRPHWAQAFDAMYAMSQRYWGLEANNLDQSVDHVLSGIKCVNWLTFIGTELGAKDLPAIQQAQKVSFSSYQSAQGWLFQAEEKPRYIDRNRLEPLGGYGQLAKALEVFQIDSHAPFGGKYWTEDNIMKYLKRFSLHSD
jgi:hypothetical protein